MRKLFVILILGVFLISSASAFQEHVISTDWSIGVTSNNATSCNVSQLQKPDGTIEYVNEEMSKNGASFNYTLDGSYLNILGDSCTSIVCSDGSNLETGSVCRQITSTGNKNGSLFFLILITSLGVVFFLATLFVDEEFLVYMCGIFFLIGGIYIMINGLGIMNDTNTRYVAYSYLGIGMLFTLGAYIYNHYGKGDEEEY